MRGESSGNHDKLCAMPHKMWLIRIWSPVYCIRLRRHAINAH